MQSLGAVTVAQLKASVQAPKAKFEIYYNNAWVDLTALGGKNYLKAWSISLGGATMTPEPVAGAWSAVIDGADGEFYPANPDGAYKDYFTTGRKVRISVGGTYGGVDVYWQRIVGVMDSPQFTPVVGGDVQLQGMDYSQYLTDFKLKSPNNYWGTSVTKSTAAAAYSADLTGGKSVAVDSTYLSYVAGNAIDNDGATFWSSANSSFPHWIRVDLAASYAITRLTISARNWGSGLTVKDFSLLGSPDDTTWTTVYTGQMANSAGVQTFTFINLMAYRYWKINVTSQWVDPPTSNVCQIFEIEMITGGEGIYRYIMPSDCTGVYSAYWNGSPIYNGADWTYVDATKEFVFNPDKVIAAGVNNLVLYYFQVQLPENIVADILVSAGLYATRALALTAMGNPATGITIDRVSFPGGNSALYSIGQLCERCNYRFYFNYAGTPVFAPAPTIKGGGLEDFALEQSHIASPSYYEDTSELYNDIDVLGEEKAQPIGMEQTEKSNYKGSDSDSASIAAYGKRTKSISNHLFQSDALCAAMATTLKALYKDPNKYFSFGTEFLPVPLEKGDTILAQVRLSSTGAGALWGTFHWSDGTLWGANGVVIVHRGVIRDIKINDYGATYLCELAL
jgi:hypothetical protein